MPYIQRNNGRIVGAFPNPQPGFAEEWLKDNDAEVVSFLHPVRFAALSRPAFLFMMNKIGVTEAIVEGIIGQMPSGTTAEQDAKSLALIVFRNQQTFQRDNALLASMSAAVGLTSEQVDTAWRTAEQIVW